MSTFSKMSTLSKMETWDQSQLKAIQSTFEAIMSTFDTQVLVNVDSLSKVNYLKSWPSLTFWSRVDSEDLGLDIDNNVKKMSMWCQHLGLMINSGLRDNRWNNTWLMTDMAVNWWPLNGNWWCWIQSDDNFLNSTALGHEEPLWLPLVFYKNQ